MRAKRKAPEPDYTIASSVLFKPRPRRIQVSHNVTLDDDTWAHLAAIVANGDARSKSSAIEMLVAEHKECYRDLRLRFTKESDLREFVRFCARNGDLPATWLSRKIKEALNDAD